MSCMFCTHCGGCELGRVAPAEEGFCVMCKAPVSPEEAVCSQCGAPVMKKLVVRNSPAAPGGGTESAN